MYDALTVEVDQRAEHICKRPSHGPPTRRIRFYPRLQVPVLVEGHLYEEGAAVRIRVLEDCYNLSDARMPSLSSGRETHTKDVRDTHKGCHLCVVFIECVLYRMCSVEYRMCSVEYVSGTIG